MLKVTDAVYIGNSYDERKAVGFKGVLNVACDLAPTRDCMDAVEYAHIGLLDGPGNELSDYVSATFALTSLIRRWTRVMVCCHTGGGRSLAVVVMYLTLTGGKRRAATTAWSYWPTWQEALEGMYEKMTVRPLEEPHAAHAEAYAAMPWGVLEVLL